MQPVLKVSRGPNLLFWDPIYNLEEIVVPTANVDILHVRMNDNFSAGGKLDHGRENRVRDNNSGFRDVGVDEVPVVVRQHTDAVSGCGHGQWVRWA